MTISKKRNKSLTWFWNNARIEDTTVYKYLGVIIDNSGQFTIQKMSIRGKGVASAIALKSIKQ